MVLPFLGFLNVEENSPPKGLFLKNMIKTFYRIVCLKLFIFSSYRRKLVILLLLGSVNPVCLLQTSLL